MEESVTWISSVLETVPFGSGSLDQTLNFEPENAYKTNLKFKETDAKGKIEERLYQFYLYQIDPNALQLIISGKELYIELAVSNELKYIKNWVNRKLKNYTSSTEIYFNDIQLARNFLSTLKYTIQNINVASTTWPT